MERALSDETASVLPPTPSAAGQRLWAVLPRRVVNGYSCGSLTGGVYGTLPGLLLLPYLTDVLGVAPAAAGLVALAPVLWLTAVTPWVGRMSDHPARFLKTRGHWVLSGGMGLAAVFPLVFLTPLRPGTGAQTVVVVIALIVAATLYAAFQGPYMAFAADATADARQGTRLMARRVIVLAVTILVVGGLAPAVLAALPGAAGFRLMGIGAGALIAVGTVGSWIFALARTGTGRPGPHPARPRTAGRGAVRSVLGSRPFRSLLANYALQGVATGASLSGLVYVATYVVHDVDVASGIFVSLFGAMILAVPGWEWLGARTGKRAALALGSAVYIAGSLALLGIAGLPHSSVYAVGAVVGIGYSAMQVFPMSMLPDVTAHEATTTGRPMRAGLYGGVWTSVETGSLAVGSVVFSLVLALGGYRAGLDGQVVAQSSTAARAMVLGFAGLPALTMALSLVPLARYRLSPPQENR